MSNMTHTMLKIDNRPRWCQIVYNPVLCWLIESHSQVEWSRLVVNWCYNCLSQRHTMDKLKFVSRPTWRRLRHRYSIKSNRCDKNEKVELSALSWSVMKQHVFRTWLRQPWNWPLLSRQHMFHRAYQISQVITPDVQSTPITFLRKKVSPWLSFQETQIVCSFFR